MNDTGSPAFALHLDDIGYISPNIFYPCSGPFIGMFGHRGGRRNRIYGTDFVYPIGNIGYGFIAVNTYHFYSIFHNYSFMFLGSGIISMA